MKDAEFEIGRKREGGGFNYLRKAEKQRLRRGAWHAGQLQDQPASNPVPEIPTLLDSSETWVQRAAPSTSQGR